MWALLPVKQVRISAINSQSTIKTCTDRDFTHGMFGAQCNEASPCKARAVLWKPSRESWCRPLRSSGRTPCPLVSPRPPWERHMLTSGQNNEVSGWPLASRHCGDNSGSSSFPLSPPPAHPHRTQQQNWSKSCDLNSVWGTQPKYIRRYTF